MDYKMLILWRMIIDYKINSSQEINNLRKVNNLRKICVLETKDTRAALASISRQWFDNPQENLKIISVTGTKARLPLPG